MTVWQYSFLRRETINKKMAHPCASLRKPTKLGLKPINSDLRFNLERLYVIFKFWNSDKNCIEYIELARAIWRKSLHHDQI